MKYFFPLLVAIVAVHCSFAQTTPWTTSGNNIYNNNTGYVGINLANPSQTLDVNGTTRLGGGDYSSTTVLSVAPGAIGFDAPGVSGGRFFISGSTGNVGIGTVSPDSKLSVNGTTRLGGGIDYSSTTVLSVASGAIGFDAPGVSGGRFFISGSTGNVGIGTVSPDSKLSVNGTIHSTAVRVDLTGFPDYVFKPRYLLPPLSFVEAYINKHQHLPEVPSEQEVIKNGLDLGEMNKLLVKKVEELTLYLIEKDKKLTELEKRIETLERKP
jgi:hypothetical protein